ncbi:MAG: CpaF family protein [Clostridia bacterium]|nr:CpaF family protein [Clostridia bacterium]
MDTDRFYALCDQVRSRMLRETGNLLKDSGTETSSEMIRDRIRMILRDLGQYSEDNAEKVYDELAGDSVLAPYIRDEEIDEININRWDDIVLTYNSGAIVRAEETFRSPSHALDICRRMLRHAGRVLDNAMPVCQGHLQGHMRLTVIKEPVIDPSWGVSASLRRLRPSTLGRDELIRSGMLTNEMMDFLESAIRYGLSLVIAGRTSSGKTTLLNCLGASFPDDKRIYTIESGARELELSRYDSTGRVCNNVVHTLSRPSDNPSLDVSQEMLVTTALRFDPDLIIIGEIRDAEAHGSVEASLTGHTVLTTVHSGPGEAAHTRMSLLCQRRFNLGMDVSMHQTRQAFPIVCFMHRGEDGVRRVTDITECTLDPSGHAEYRTLYVYDPDRGFLKKNDISQAHLHWMHLCGYREGGTK